MNEELENQQVKRRAKRYVGLIRPVRVKSTKDALRLLSRTLLQIQKETISTDQARCIAYVVNSFIKTFETSEMETRIIKLEKEIGIK